MTTNYARIKTDFERRRGYHEQALKGAASALRFLVDAIIDYTQWPNDKAATADTWTLVEQRKAPLEGHDWYLVENGNTSCGILFTLSGARIVMTLAARATDQPRMYKVQFFNKETQVDIYDDDSIAAFCEQAARELRHQFRETAPG